MQNSAIRDLQFGMKRLGWLVLAGAALCGGCKGGGAKGPHAMDFPIPVKMEPVVVESIEEKISLVGTLSANEMVEVRPEISAPVKKIQFVEGEWIEEGTPLLELDDEKLSAQLAEQQASFELAEANFRRSAELIKRSAVSQQDFDEMKSKLQVQTATLQRTKRELDDTKIKAPFHGMTGQRMVSTGQYVQPTDIITTLVDLTPIKANFRVPERYLGILKTGQKVSLSVAAFPKEHFEGTVYFISPVVEEATRTVMVRAELPNEDRRLIEPFFLPMVLPDR